MGRSVALNLISGMQSRIQYRLFFDNLFTSLSLIEHLKSVDIGVTGAIRVNCTGKTPLMDSTDMKKIASGKYCYVKEKDSGCILVR